MSLYGMCQAVPEYYMICIINSGFMSYYVDNFVNNTQTFQINDARQLPVIIPSNISLIQFKNIFDDAVKIKQQQFSSVISLKYVEEKLNNIQNQLDELVNELYAI